MVLSTPSVDCGYRASFGLRGLMLRTSRRSIEYEASSDQPDE